MKYSVEKLYINKLFLVILALVGAAAAAVAPSILTTTQ